MSLPKARYATRRSALALAQCRAFIAALVAKHPGLETEELQVVTTGDRIVDRPLSEVGGKGLFVKEIEEALLEGRADLAVHSIKDVPAATPPGLAIVCIPERADARDVLVARAPTSLAALPKGAKVGTSSLRRAALLRAARPDLVFLPLRGNVDTRLRKLDAGEYDAIVLAAAGLARLGVAREVVPLGVHESLPAVGQGALGIEARESDLATRALLAPLHHEATAICVGAERGVMAALEGDCKTPLGAHATREGGELFLRAFLADGDGMHLRFLERRFPWPDEAGARAVGLELGAALRALA